MSGKYTKKSSLKTSEMTELFEETSTCEPPCPMDIDIPIRCTRKEFTKNIRNGHERKHFQEDVVKCETPPFKAVAEEGFGVNMHHVKVDQAVEVRRNQESPFGNCAGCGLIITNDAIVARKKHYHPHCFRCETCHKKLGISKFYIVGGKFYCPVDRYNFLERCTKCARYIEDKIVRRHRTGQPYHPECLTCKKCFRTLHGKFYQSSNEFYCEEDFKDTCDKCHKCDKPIMETSLEALGKMYHPNCFVCSKCHRPLNLEQFFVSEDNEPICRRDYERHLAKTCNKCNWKVVEECYVETSESNCFHLSCYK